MKGIILQWKNILFIIYSYDLYRKYSNLFMSQKSKIQSTQSFLNI